CPNCEKPFTTVSAEALPEGAGAGDFDAQLVIMNGPQRKGETLALGGVADIEIGKLQGKNIQLVGPMVSRTHCKVVRVDFGPSRWQLEDLKSSNGLFVNGQRVETHELKDGDSIDVGDFELKFVSVGEEPVPVAAAASSSGGVV